VPELPDVTLYVEALERHTVGQCLEQARIVSPSLLRTFDPPITSAEGRVVRGAERIGKRIVIALEGELFLVFHLMIAGRLRWKPPGAKPPGKRSLATFGFAKGTLLLTEASTRKRATLHVVAGRDGLAEFDRGGLEVLGASAAAFAAALRRENHTLKRSLTDPSVLSGIGNAYSDEILHRARMSPVKWTSRLTDEEIEVLLEATQTTLTEWTERLRSALGDGFPDKVTAFHAEMAVHGRYRQPCPTCSAPIQRIVHASNESNYCAACQTGGKLLADRALSRLLKKDWPRTLEEMERRRNS
jgi:formamidopyrimidine-DNA glycosylase